MICAGPEAKRPPHILLLSLLPLLFSLLFLLGMSSYPSFNLSNSLNSYPKYYKPKGAVIYIDIFVELQCKIICLGSPYCSYNRRYIKTHRFCGKMQRLPIKRLWLRDGQRPTVLKPTSPMTDMFRIFLLY